MVSIIVPIYNASIYIANGYANILAQTYSDWELIFVNDGSRDDSAARLEDFAAKDCRISIIHQTNAGPGEARNAGLRIAKGKWIFFFDIDDQISPNLLQYCVERAEEHDVDLVNFGFDAYDKVQEEHTCSEFTACIMHTNQEIGEHWPSIMRQSVIGNGFPWNKIYRRSFLVENNLWFGTERIMEDELFNLRLLRVAKSMVVVNKILYTYYCNNTGNSRQQFIINRFEIATNVRDEMLSCAAHWHIKDFGLEEYIDKRYWISIKLCLLNDTHHPHNALPLDQKKARIVEICNHASVMGCIRNLMRRNMGFEDRLYAVSILKKNYTTLSVWGKIFKALRSIKHIGRSLW